MCLLRPRGGPGPVGPLSIRHESLRRRGGPGAVETSTPRTVLRRPRLSTQAKNKNSKNMAPYNTLPQTTNEAEETLLQAQKPKTSLIIPRTLSYMKTPRNGRIDVSMKWQQHPVAKIISSIRSDILHDKISAFQSLRFFLANHILTSCSSGSPLAYMRPSATRSRPSTRPRTRPLVQPTRQRP